VIFISRSVVACCALAAGAVLLSACGSTTAPDGTAAAPVTTRPAPATTTPVSTPTATPSAAATPTPAATPSAASPTASAQPPVTASAGAAGLPRVTGAADTKKKPGIAAGGDSPPARLVVSDLVAGKGRAATDANTVTIHYVGVNYTDGKQFDASWDNGSPAEFPLNQVIPGFRQGIAGMKVGGRRELVIPPALAYGATGTPDGTVGPNATLVFVVDLVSLK
jgi:peptidylprolyl isomerase